MGKGAFTFVELMVVALIIAILAAIAVPNFLEFQTRARVSRTKADMAAVRAALAAYRMEYRIYPLNAEAGQADQEDLIVLTTPLAFMVRLPIEQFTPRARFRYYNAMQVDPENGLKIANPVGGLHGLVPALMWSTGPDCVPLAEQEELYLRLTPTAEAEVLVYDPTNGTTSAGGILLPVP
ncbi:prepilin-type N-terminal cleavage/methylation domain-containing protein [Candidatus Sumerlaeota bacterium]